MKDVPKVAPVAPSIGAVIALLRERIRPIGNRAARSAQAVAALHTLAIEWQEDLSKNWLPPEESAFPWQQIEPSLRRFLSDLQNLSAYGKPQLAPEDAPCIVGLILAGNTPLAGYPAIVAALVAGHAIFAKLSRDETVWIPVLADRLRRIDLEVAQRLYFDIWQGTDPRSAELVQSVDAVIAYGSDTTIAAIRDATPKVTPLYGFGHSISVALLPQGASLTENAAAIARDTLTFRQQGCLSPQAVFVEGDPVRAHAAARAIAAAMPETAERLAVSAVTEPAIAIPVRQARDLAAFAGAEVRGDAGLRWSIFAYPETIPVPAPVGWGVLPVIPVASLETDLSELLEPLRGRVSAVGASLPLSATIADYLHDLGVTYVCPFGEMQTPPLTWANAGCDLFRELMGLPSSEKS
ncbi:MAG: hypothetical protein OHK0029_12030 [Armatimonadaceae bacterium]